MLNFHRFGIRFCHAGRYGYFRIGGVGVSWKDTRQYRYLAARDRVRKGAPFGPWWIEWWWV